MQPSFIIREKEVKNQRERQETAVDEDSVYSSNSKKEPKDGTKICKIPKEETTIVSKNRKSHSFSWIFPPSNMSSSIRGGRIPSWPSSYFPFALFTYRNIQRVILCPLLTWATQHLESQQFFGMFWHRRWRHFPRLIIIDSRPLRTESLPQFVHPDIYKSDKDHQ